MEILTLRLASFLTALLVTLSAPAMAEVPANCTLTALAGPERYALKCTGALVIELEPGAVLKYSGEADGLPERLILEDGRALIEVTPGSVVPQIRTPHAIAAVRGTVYAIEVGADSTAVFVLRGAVGVRTRQGPRDTATLTAGQGVDVTPGEALTVNTWGAARVDELLARFGR